MTSKNYSISILRVLGMFSIVLCHITSWLGISFLSQFFNYGVYLFLLISGFLYADKTIDNPLKWYGMRLKKLLPIFYCFVIPVMIYYFCFNNIDLKQIFTYLFCLQGISFITNMVPSSEIEPLGNLWFITIILLCYALTLIVKKFEKKRQLSPKIIVIIMLTLWILSSIVEYLRLPYISLDYFIVYFIGYYIAKFKVKNTKLTFLLFGICLFICSIAIRLFGKYLFDQFCQEIYLIIVSITQLGIAISLYFIVAFITEKSSTCMHLSETKFWTTMDKLSYPIYITHYAFLNSVTSVDKLNYSKPLGLIIFIILTLVSSILLYWINVGLQKRFLQKRI